MQTGSKRTVRRGLSLKEKQVLGKAGFRGNDQKVFRTIHVGVVKNRIPED
jgi:hypothetical protein